MEKLWSKGKYGRYLAAALSLCMMAGLLIASGTPGEAKAENNGVSEKASVGAVTDIKDMKFEGTNKWSTPYKVTGNTIRLADKSSYEWITGGIGSSSTASDGLNISLTHSWRMEGIVYLPSVDLATYGEGGYSQRLFMTLTGKTNTSEKLSAELEALGVGTRKLTYGGKAQTLSPAQFHGTHNITLTYDCQNKKFLLKFGELASIMYSSPFSNETDAALSIFGQSAYSKNKTEPDMVVEYTFSSFEYTDYAPQITSTKLLDSQGREVKGKVGSNQIVTVETTLRNQDGKQDSVPMTLKLSDIAGSDQFENIQPLAGADQDVKVNGTSVNGSITGGIPCTVSPSGTVITYKAKVNGPVNDTLLIPHLAEDAYFSKTDLPTSLSGQGKLYATVERVVNRDLISDFDSETGFDYSHSSKPNKRGWYNKDLALTFVPSADFDELYIDENKETVYKIDQETDEDGVDLTLYGRKKSDGSLSGIKEENVKLDKTKPGIEVKSRKDRELILTDDLSGIERIQIKRPGESEFSDMQVFAQADAVTGPTREDPVSYEELKKDGTYHLRVYDMAGNYTDLALVNKAPVIQAKDKMDVKYSDTKSSYIPADDHEVKITDDEDIPLSRLSWKIEKKKGSTAPESFTPVSGTGLSGVGSYLPIGFYTVTFNLDGDGKDGDGNKPKDKTVTLRVVPNGPPAVADEENTPVNPSQDPVVDANTGTEHALVKDEVTIVANPEEPYKGGQMDKDKAAEEVGDRFQFIPQVDGDTLSDPAVTIRQNGVEVSAIDTTKQGSYVIIYRVQDSSGCSTTVELTFNVLTDCTVTFDSDKGEFKDGSLTRTQDVKVGRSLTEPQIPGASQIKAPALTAFIGWSTARNAKTPIDLSSYNINKNVTLYAVYGPDVSGDNVDDREQALFTFESSDTSKGAIKAGDGTTVGVTLGKNESGSLKIAQIPSILFGAGYSLEGFKTDATKDELLTAEDLCSLKRKPGTVLKCTAYFKYTEPGEEEVTKAAATFFSADAATGRLKGDDGVRVGLEAKDGQAVIKKSQIPSISYGKGSALKGWKTDMTGNRLLTTDEMCKLKLAAGDKITCIAYIDSPEKTVTVEKESTKGKENTKTVVSKQVQAAAAGKEKADKDAVYTFYSSDTAQGIIEGGDGKTVVVAAGTGKKVYIKEELIPKVKTDKKNIKGILWKTSATGSRLLTSKELSKLPVTGGMTVTCTAFFRMEGMTASKEEGSSGRANYGELTTFVGDEQVPLGAGPENGTFADNSIKSCKVHWFLIVWLGLCMLFAAFEIHMRKREDNLRRTGASDFIYMIGGAGIGAVLFIMRQCPVDVYLFAAGGLVIVYYLIRMVMLDRKAVREERLLYEQTAQEFDDAGRK